MGDVAHPTADRLERLDELLSDRSLASVWFARPSSFAWLTGGDNVVDRTGDIGIAGAGYDGESVTVITDNIEAPRLREEQLPASVEIVEYDWHSSSLASEIQVRSPMPAAADFDIEGFEQIDASTVRQPLAEADIERYRQLGETVASAVEDVCRSIDPAESERAVAGRLRGRLAAAGVDSPVTLVGGSKRAPAYRHLTPTDQATGRYAIVSVTAQRWGLFVSCTRTVALDSPEWLQQRHRQAARVEATALAATREFGGREERGSAIFEQIQQAYDTIGWPEEWRRHHQGGPAGFAGREWIATPETSKRAVLPMAYAWNPTVEGAKSEGTVLVTESGYERLTAGEWPTITVDAVGYDEQFERPAVLD